MSSGLPRPLQIAGQRARGLDRARHRRREQRAGVDRDDVVRARAHEADFVRSPMRKARVKSRAPPSGAMGVDQRGDLRLQMRAPQRLDHEAALPVAIERLPHVLRGAAAAGPEPAAEGLCPLGARALDADEFGSSSGKPNPRALAGQRAGDGCAVRRDAVAARRRARRSRGLPTLQSWRAAIRNSRAPAPPSTGDGMRPRTRPPLRLDRRRARRRMRARAPPRS